MRTCLIHVGTHKTGTTSLQIVLDANRDELQRYGYLYPRTAIPTYLWGHHNVAWELIGDPRFRREHGSIDDLISEISHSDHSVILSSEDFEIAVYYPNKFKDFVEHLRSCGLHVTVVVYLRNQIDYLRSMYLENLKFGLKDTFAEFMERVLKPHSGRPDKWIFAFDYGEFLRLLTKATGTNPMVRSYEQAEDSSVIVDFLSIVGLTPKQLSADPNLRANMQMSTTEGLLLFYKNRTGEPLDDTERKVIQWLSRHCPNSADISERGKRDLIKRLYDSNQYVRKTYGLETASIGRDSGNALEQSGAISLESIFSSEFQLTVCKLAGLERERDAREASFKAEIAQLQAQHSNQTAEIERLQNALSMIHSRGALSELALAFKGSVSWLTKPLRWTRSNVSRLLRRDSDSSSGSVE